MPGLRDEMDEMLISVDARSGGLFLQQKWASFPFASADNLHSRSVTAADSSFAEKQARAPFAGQAGDAAPLNV